MDLSTIKCTQVGATFAEFTTTDYTLRIESSATGVFRLLAWQGKCPPKNARQTAEQKLLIEREENLADLSVHDSSLRDGWLLQSGDCSVEIKKNPFSIAFARQNKCLLQTSTQYSNSLDHDEENWALAFDLPPTTPVYGLCMTTGGYNRRQQDITSDLPQFQSVPFAWSTQGWGVYVAGFERSQHNVALEEDNTYIIRTSTPVLDVYLFLAEPCEIFNQYTALTGRAGQPTFSAMGVGLQQLEGQSTQAFLDFAQQVRADHLHADSLYFANPSLLPFDADRLNMEFDPQRVSEPHRAYFETLAKESWHSVIPTFAGIAQDTYLFEELEDRGWLLMNEDGTAHRFAPCPASGHKAYGLLDLSYKDAFQFFKQRHHQLLTQGQAARIQWEGITIPDGVTNRYNDSSSKLRTLYPCLLKQAIFAGLSEKITPPEGVVVHDTLGLAEQRTPWLQLPMMHNTWQGLQNLYQQMLSAQMATAVAVVHTVGHYEPSAKPLDPELYLRLLALSVFSAQFVFPADARFLPTAYDESVQAVAQQWMQWRYRMIPYVLGVIEDSTRTGLPVQRSMALCFAHDDQAVQCEQQFMFGPALLVAPILEAGNTKTVYLPKGSAWWDLNNGQRYEGGQWLECECDLDTIPLFGQEGYMFSLGPVMNHLGDFNSSRVLDEIWLFGMPEHNPVVMRNKIRVMQMQGSSYIKGLEGLKIVPSPGLEVKRRGAEVRISHER